jgi:hypothetical protein
MLSVSYAECQLCSVSVMLSVAIKPFILNVIRLSVVFLSVVAPFRIGSEKDLLENPDIISDRY